MTALFLLGALGCVRVAGGPYEHPVVEATTVTDLVVTTPLDQYTFPVAAVRRVRALPAPSVVCQQRTTLSLASAHDGITATVTVPNATGSLDPEGSPLTLSSPSDTVHGSLHLVDASGITWIDATSFVLTAGRLCDELDPTDCVLGDVQVAFFGALPEPTCVSGPAHALGWCSANEGLPVACSVDQTTI